eukprot:TRINITY_DN4806_c0_g1_i2.p1 TRINITY_DN4806_c0_g1~~TRINITY_DN4806_c0_g1_i2.p1  ORF type:complete len:183 (-),score=45.42 TRINITY_DN4806_c0_g1_i2:34-516(-)
MQAGFLGLLVTFVCLVEICGAEAPNKIIVPGVGRLPVFSSASVVDRTIYVSGTLGTLNNSISIVPGGIGPETKQAMANIQYILEYVIFNVYQLPKVNVWDQVAKVTVYLRDTDKATFDTMNAAYASFFSDVSIPPARMSFSGAHLALGAAVEIEAIAQLN